MFSPLLLDFFPFFRRVPLLSQAYRMVPTFAVRLLTCPTVLWSYLTICWVSELFPRAISIVRSFSKFPVWGDQPVWPPLRQGYCAVLSDCAFFFNALLQVLLTQGSNDPSNQDTNLFTWCLYFSWSTVPGLSPQGFFLFLLHPWEFFEI